MVTVRVAKGKNLPVFPTYFVCVPYLALNQQQIYPDTVFTDCVSNVGTLIVGEEISVSIIAHTN